MLDNLLTHDDRKAGFSLWEDDHCVYVTRWGKEVAVFSSSGMTKDSLREFLDKAREAIDIYTPIDQGAADDQR